MLWPERPDNWRDGAKPAQAVFAAVAAAIALRRAGDGRRVRRAIPKCARAPRAARAGRRDHAATTPGCATAGRRFVVDAKGRRRGVDWSFNAWGGLCGGLYFPWDRDDEVAQKVLEIEGADRYRTSFVLEGGAIHVDGQGTCLTTEECLLNPNRNPGLTRADIEDTLRRYLGVSTVIWLGRGRLSRTRPAATSTSWPASRAPARSR